MEEPKNIATEKAFIQGVEEGSTSTDQKEELTSTDGQDANIMKETCTSIKQLEVIPVYTSSKQEDVDPEREMCTSTDQQEVNYIKEINQQKVNLTCTSNNQQEVYISREMYTSTDQLEVNPIKEMCTLIKQQKVTPKGVYQQEIFTSTDFVEVNPIKDMCSSIKQHEVNPMQELCASTNQQEVNPFKEILEFAKQDLNAIKSSETSLEEQRKLFALETNDDEDEDTEAEILPKTKEMKGYVGFANILKQAFQKVVKKGFEFTLMVVGESGLGKSTLVNSMFLTDIYHSADNPGLAQRMKKTVTVETTSVLLNEDGVNLMLTLVDTPGFGDAVDNSKSWEPISEYIDGRFEDFLNSEAQPLRRQTRDERVHCCLYFIQPSGHGLKPLDIEFMKRLCGKVNVVPVIGKADTLTTDECAAFKKQIMLDIAEHEIKIYDFPDHPEGNLNKSLKERIPFAVVGSNALIEINGRKLRGRKYPWGIAEVENLEHCDFVALRTMMIRTHLEDLKDVTNNIHYENYRVSKLGSLGPNGKPGRKNKNQLAKEEQDFKIKIETEMREKEQQLRNSADEVNRRLDAARQRIEEQAKELDEQRKQFEFEKEQWEKESHDTMEALTRRTLEVERDEGDGKKEKQKKKRRGFFKK